jgi:hypothetical protein
VDAAIFPYVTPVLIAWKTVDESGRKLGIVVNIVWDDGTQNRTFFETGVGVLSPGRSVIFPSCRCCSLQECLPHTETAA